MEHLASWKMAAMFKIQLKPLSFPVFGFFENLSQSIT
jgi:hypothetical protein